MSFLLKSRNILVSVPSSPASKISRTPNSSNLSITATHRTGESIWFRNASLTPSAVASTAPSVAPTIGISGPATRPLRAARPSPSAASAMSGEWKAPATCSSTLRPRTLSADVLERSVLARDDRLPRGVEVGRHDDAVGLLCDAWTTPSGSAPIRATIPPGFSAAASFISRSLSATSRTAVLEPRLPAACAAAYSPSECPATTSASTPASRNRYRRSTELAKTESWYGTSSSPT